MTNTEMLNQLIQESGLKKVYLAEKVGLSPQGFYNCLTNRAEFRASQIQTLCELLGVEDAAQKDALFFAHSGA